MDQNQRQLMKKINESSFAMDDVLLYLDTHPTDLRAMNFYHYVAGMRKEAMDIYEKQYGPLMVDSVPNQNEWTWTAGKWPWEGEV